MIQCFKYAKQIQTTSCLDFSSATSARYNSLKIKKTRCNKRPYSNFFTKQCVDLWNSLPKSVVSAPTVITFESRLDHHWRHHPLRLNPDAPALQLPDHLSSIYTPT